MKAMRRRIGNRSPSTAYDAGMTPHMRRVRRRQGGGRVVRRPRLWKDGPKEPSLKAPTFTTARLLLQPLAMSDAPAIQSCFPQWKIVKYLSAQVPWPYPEDGALAFVRDVALPAMREGTAWHWSIRPQRDPGRLIGMISLMDNPDDNRGFWLDPAWWGQGLMMEASTVVTDFWFETLDRPLLRVPKAIVNVRSSKLSERMNMRRAARMERRYVSGQLPAELWEITRAEWTRYRYTTHHIEPDAGGA